MVSLVATLINLFKAPILLSTIIPLTICFLTKFELNENILFFALSLISWIIGTTVILYVTYLFYNGKFFIFLSNPVGEGTILPESPTKKLVVEGLFCYTRNPMLTSVFLNILAISLFFKSVFVLIYFIVFVFVSTTFTVKFEEVELAERYGDQYDLYIKNVPRFIPRLTKFEFHKIKAK
jgi:protein-S-isoprenylcysteine O-methyltransferase Ste14